MPSRDPLAAKLKSDNYLGFDFGVKKIGVAVGQIMTGIASPLTTIRAHQDQPNWPLISQLCAEWRPVGLIVGISKQADGQDNQVTPRMQKFCRQLGGRYRLPVYQVDEVLTTYEAKQLLFDDLQVKAAKLWAVQDQIAAQLILQTWLNHQAITTD